MILFVAGLGRMGEQEFMMNTEESWSIEDGLLVIESTRSTPRGDMTRKTVYDRSE